MGAEDQTKEGKMWRGSSQVLLSNWRCASQMLGTSEVDIPYRGLDGMKPAKPPRAAQLCLSSSFHTETNRGTKSEKMVRSESELDEKDLD